MLKFSMYFADFLTKCFASQFFQVVPATFAPPFYGFAQVGGAARRLA
jgi:hypothetical protein